MNKTPIFINPSDFPEEFRSVLAGTEVFDSSCSPEARVWYLPEGGLYLKSAPKDALRREADMTRFLHKKGVAAEVLAYQSQERDWLLTRAVSGEDCTCSRYLEDPRRLSSLLGESLRMLHELPTKGCPVTDHTAAYLETAGRNHRKGLFDPSYFPGGPVTAGEAWALVRENAQYLKNEVILHGDYCLPNILLENWRFSGFIDLDHGGIGDRHVDLFWGCWTLSFNLKTDRFRERFLDAYGRDRVNEELLTVIGAIEVFG